MSSHWFKKLTSHFDFPENYTTIDLETNGTNAEKHEICTVGYTVVRDRQPVATHELVLNWPDYPHIDHAEFRLGLQQAAEGMARKGDVLFHTWDYMKQHGLPPMDVLNHLLELVEGIEARQEVMILHNGWKFDAQFMMAAFHNHLGVVYEIEPESVYDSGIMEKASQLSDADNPLPLEHETLKDFSFRIGSLRRRGIMWALHHHCEENYNLTKLAGLSPNEAHKGGADSLLIHKLFEEHRRLAELVDG